MLERGANAGLLVVGIDTRIDSGKPGHTERGPGGARAAIVSGNAQRIFRIVGERRIGGEAEIGADLSVPLGRQRLFNDDRSGAVRPVGARQIRGR